MSLPLDTMNSHGREVMQRLHTLPGSMLTPETNIPYDLSISCPLCK